MLLKLPYSKAQAVLKIYEPADEIDVDPELPPEDYIKVLTDQKLYTPAGTFLAHALPIREAVWWAYCCARQLTEWNEKEAAALEAGRQWVLQGNEESRREAEKAAKLAELQTGAGWVAQAAFWSGGSIVPPDLPFVAPPPHIHAKAVAGAVQLCAVLPDGQQKDKRYPIYLKIGLNIAEGGSGEI